MASLHENESLHCCLNIRTFRGDDDSVTTEVTMRSVSENLRVQTVGIAGLSFIREEFARTIDPSGDTEITDSPT